MTAPQLAEMEAAEVYDPCGFERLELALATLTSVVTGLLGKGSSPSEVAADWGGLRARARLEAAAGRDLLGEARSGMI